MRNRKKSLRQQHIWFSVWNAKIRKLNDKYPMTEYPLRISNK